MPHSRDAGDGVETTPKRANIRLRDELAALDRAYSPGHHGLWLARRRAECVDRGLAALFDDAVGERAPRVALAALGGYGRGALAPASDIDVLLIVDDEATPDDLAARLLYPLWDSGFVVGHAVRTLEQCAEISRERLDALTAMLDLRPIAGDERLAMAARSVAVAVAAEDPVAFGGRLREAAAERHERHGSVAQLLEPDLKEGSGGLRDVQSVGWLEIAFGASLEGVDLLRTGERRALSDAEEFLVRVRSALHLETGKATDRLVLEQQPPIARAMGFEDEPGLIAVDGLMRALFEHARQVEHITGQLFGRLGGATTLARDSEPLRDPAAVLRSLAAAAEGGEVPSVALLDAVEATDLPTEIRWDEDVREGFLRILRAGARGAAALDVLDRLGLLVRFLPEWAAVRCRPQRDPYHRFTVDAHLLQALAEIARLLESEGGDDPVAKGAVEQLDDVDGVLLGTLLHDIGKTGAAGGHVDNGAGIAVRVLDRIGVQPATRELAAFMVREHLLLSDTATRRDLTDEDLVLDVAARIGTAPRLAALYLLAEADARATGPFAWTPWRQTLVRELVGKVQRVMDRGEMGAEIAERLAKQVGRLRELLAAERDDDVDRFVMRMPRGYFLAVEPGQAARHFAAIASDVGATEVRTVPAPGTRAGAYELLVVAQDRPGLLSWIAGALSIAGMSILTAQVFTTEDGVAADLFEVEGAFEPEIGEGRWREFRSLLRKAVEGRISLEGRMDEKRRHYPPPSTEVSLTVRVDNDASDFFTVIEVGAADRIGLLYDITRGLTELELDVHLAKVATYGGRVVDAFYVRDAVGRKVLEADRVAGVETALQTALTT